MTNNPDEYAYGRRRQRRRRPREREKEKDQDEDKDSNKAKNKHKDNKGGFARAGRAREPAHPCRPKHPISKACLGNLVPAICRHVCCESMHNALPIWCHGAVPETCRPWLGQHTWNGNVCEGIEFGQTSTTNNPAKQHMEPNANTHITGRGRGEHGRPWSPTSTVSPRAL